MLTVAGCAAGNGAAGQAQVTFGSNDAGATSVNCATDNGLTTITVDGDQHTTVIVTDEDTPVVESVSIGEIGSDAPALAYLAGVAATPAQATRDGRTYTVTGNGMGSDANATAPADTPFEITVTCP